MMKGWGWPLRMIHGGAFGRLARGEVAFSMSWDGAICALDTRNTNASSRWTPVGRGVGCGAVLVRVECFSVGVDGVRNEGGRLCWARGSRGIASSRFAERDGANGRAGSGWELSALREGGNFFFFFFFWVKFLDWFRFIARRRSTRLSASFCCCWTFSVHTFAWTAGTRYTGARFYFWVSRVDCVGATRRFGNFFISRATAVQDGVHHGVRCVCSGGEAKAAWASLLREHWLAQVHCRANGGPIRVCESACPLLFAPLL